MAPLGYKTLSYTAGSLAPHEAKDSFLDASLSSVSTWYCPLEFPSSRASKGTGSFSLLPEEMGKKRKRSK